MEPDRWLGIELRHLMALEAVAREGSFGRAAKTLGYTQSAVTQQIAALERIVAARLVHRPAGPRVEVARTESATDAEFRARVEPGEVHMTSAGLPLVEGPFAAVELLRDP